MDDWPPAGPLQITRRRALGLAAIGAVATSTRWVCPWPALAQHAASTPVVAEIRLRADVWDLARPATDMLRSRVIRAPRRFDLVGLRRDGRSIEPVEIRARRAGGHWSPWAPLMSGGDHAPDGARRRAGEPVWFAGSDELQLQTMRPGRPIGLYLVESRPRDPSFARSAAAPGGGPPVILRSAWGGDAVIPRAPASYGDVQLAFVHHTVTANEYRPQDSAAMVLAIARYHRDANGWNDIGYNFLVDRYGQIFEGRAGGIEQAVIGAQAQGYNATSTGIALLGSHGTRAATPEAVTAVSKLIGWKLARHGVPASGLVQVTSAGGPQNRFPKGQLVSFQRVAAHRDGDHTACPGAALAVQLPQIRTLAAQAAVGVAPATRSPDPLVSSTLTRRVRARGRGVLVRGSAPATAARARIAVSRKVGGRWRWMRSVRINPRSDGAYSVRIRLPTPGLYRLVASAGDERAAPLLVRSIRG